MLTLSVEMYETDNGTLVASLSPIRSENAVELLEKGAAACGEMYRKFAGTKTLTARQQKKAEKAAQKEVVGSYTVNTYNDNSLENEYKDFSKGQRWATGLLNIFLGSGSFFLMEDYLGGSIIFVISSIGATMYMYSFDNADVDVNGRKKRNNTLFATGQTLMTGGQIFNIIRSRTYHKPKPKSATANAANFKLYDGLKLTILPTESGDYKVYARYDYTF